ncbi:MAG: DUF2177 family protein [Patescibacteria group bacterium]|jgi:uncharacterized membrane protein|nr:DUF2177 family protein [Patescibacteria group bacterium]
MTKIISHYLISLIIFLAIDLVWLGMVAKNIYQQQLGQLMRPNPNWLAAIIFYAIYVVGILVFIVYPYQQNLTKVLLMGALFGFIAYATFDLTSLAVIKNWPLKMTIIDLIWGAVLTGSVAILSAKVLSFFK